jgi:hypothetical protein
MTKLEMILVAIEKLQEASVLLPSAGMSDGAEKADDLAAEIKAHSSSLDRPGSGTK